MGLAYLVVSIDTQDLHNDKFWVMKIPSQQCKDQTLDNMTRSAVMGTSMRPTLWPGDTVLLVEYNKEKPVVEGDLVLTHNNTLHRVYGAYDDYFTMWGDNNLVPDTERIPYSEIKKIGCGALYG
jgi:hypothetical protein